MNLDAPRGVFRASFRRRRRGARAWLGSALLAALACGGYPGRESSGPRLDYVATAHQPGPVAYRDPLGVISPDGDRLAFTAGRRLFLRSLHGGPVRELGPSDLRRTELAWLPDGTHLAARERSFDRSAVNWFLYEIASGRREALWGDAETLRGVFERGGPGTEGGATATVAIAPGDLRELAFSPDGERVAGVVRSAEGSELWILTTGRGKDGAGEARVRSAAGRLMHPAWTPAGDRVACLALSEERSLFQARCAEPREGAASWVAYGPFAFSPDGSRLYYAAPGDDGSLDLWVRRLGGGAAVRLTHFTRDTYAPSVTRAGNVLFKTQDYRASIAMAPAAGGPSRAVTEFQSETPSWNWSGTRIAFTYGSWRHVTDDLHYPDIDQQLGFVTVDRAGAAAAPEAVVRASYSEDQGMHWSPNGRWIVLHSHADGTDDVWLQPADGSRPAHPISTGGLETGWPRWSPDGRWIVYPSMISLGRGGRDVLWVIGVDQESGAVIEPQRQIPLEGFSDDVSMAEWSPDSRFLVFEADDGKGTKALYVVGRDGGRPRKFHEFASDQLYSGVSVSPDFRWAAYVAPAGGYFQIHRVPIAGGEPEQVTFDPTDKAHPAWSPDGRRIAFTVFRYAAHFWRLLVG